MSRRKMVVFFLRVKREREKRAKKNKKKAKTHDWGKFVASQRSKLRSRVFVLVRPGENNFHTCTHTHRQTDTSPVEKLQPQRAVYTHTHAHLQVDTLGNEAKTRQVERIGSHEESKGRPKGLKN